jgi:predicted dehydrogenase
MSSRLRVGVIGCGMISQVMHLPHLSELDDRFELAALCDLDQELADACANRYRVPKVFTDWRDLVAESLDVVMVLTSGSHAPAAIAACRSGANVFVEKPMCLTVAEGREMVAAAEEASVRLMVGTMKRYDPAYLRLLELLPDAGEVRLVRVTTLESPFEPYIAAYPLLRGAGPPKEMIERLRAAEAQVLADLMPEADENTRYCYRWMLLDNLVHELNMLRGALGEPDRINFVSMNPQVVELSLTFGSTECHLSWVDLPGMARYSQELVFFGLEKRLTLALPSPYLRGMPSELRAELGRPGSPHSHQTTETVSYEEAFKRELLEFHDAIVIGRNPRTDGNDGLRDVALCFAIAQSHHRGAPTFLGQETSTAAS